MTIQPPPRDLGEKILDLFQNEITIDADVMHYIDSTFSNPSIEEFTRILSDPVNCEVETVLELIFYPDMRIQKKVESILKTYNYSIYDVESATGYILQKMPIVLISFPDQRGILSVYPTDSSIRQFITRLNITRQIDTRIVKTISCFVSDEPGDLRIRVLLRNCRTGFSDPICTFLCKCIEKMYAESPFFWNAFKFLLNFFEYTDPAQDIYFSLMGEKKVLLHNIDQAEKNEKALKGNCVEALMLKGVSILSIDIADARKKIVLIDHICISIFGKTELYGYAEQIESPVTIKTFASDDFI
ncbi:MAG: hypothetical protein PF482_01025 [Desulfobacteraceae bacterium]|jgi:hypothetical protein|nr:hypothetical protein [Desulfobacteraceae bacterium]